MSYFNMITFLVTTMVYYYTMKQPLTYDINLSVENRKEYMSNHYMYLAMYFLLVVMVQFFVNASVISKSCGGSVSENMGAAWFYTFLPWTLIFGVIIIILSIYPGFKSAFADVIGYFYVSSSANRIITELLINPDVEETMENASPEEKKQNQSTADAIMKICGNPSILINQMVPTNFEDYWGVLKPLRKEKYQTDGSPETEEIKRQLFDLVVSRDNIGEAMWYIYTGVLLTSIVQMKITARGCNSNPKTMEQNYQKFREAEDALKEKQDIATSTTYTL